MKYRKILVAIDRSPQTEVVFEQALELAKKEEAALMVFHCLSLEMQPSSSYADIYGSGLVNFSAEFQVQWEKELQETRQWLEDYGHKANSEGVSTEWDLKVGNPGSAIRNTIEAWGADLVVLGRRGRRGLQEVLLGSISNHIVHHVNCSVLIVQGISPQADQAM